MTVVLEDFIVQYGASLNAYSVVVVSLLNSPSVLLFINLTSRSTNIPYLNFTSEDYNLEVT